MSNDVLVRILADTRTETTQRKAQASLAEMEKRARDASPVRGFEAALSRKVAAGKDALIAELKRKSPSGGDIRPGFDPAQLAQAYERAGAACLSVLTDLPYFGGTESDLHAARNATSLPVLRKDFIVDPWQLAETRAMGADCALLIVAALDDATLRELFDAARSYGLDVLVEAHDREEFERGAALGATMLGVNNRNLRTLVTDLATTEELSSLLPAGAALVAESGLKTRADLERLHKVGARRFLVGESLLRLPDLEAATRALLGV
ncbi:indole-3-glycerol phosphate synthase TrpC [Roseiterribacter gracilis]|uniref:Indole-3-glycerol phosphate synthase n=1 Tax=Roseiterribacter gracilis TaxID=2812848 RepID=A0A8S8X6N1_9PROT|nr:indole-3-glycerol phosphate synthase [Rhodospirillales bacterium TMPK1]